MTGVPTCALPICIFNSLLGVSSGDETLHLMFDILLPCLSLITLEVWKCGNMSSMSLSNNSGSLEMWKCGNMSSLSLPNNSGSLEVWKCGKMSSMSLSDNSGSVEMWKCSSTVFIC